MNLEIIIAFLEEKGWKRIIENSNYYFYQATPASGFPATQVIPIPVQVGLKNFRNSLQYTAQLIAKLYQSTPSKLFFDVGDYQDLLKKDAIYFKLTSNEVTYQNTLEIEYIWQFLKNLSTSYINYVKFKFNQQFAAQLNYDSKRINKAVERLLEYAQLRLVDLEFQSFSFAIATDTLMGNERIDDSSISEWRKTILTDFKKEVLDLNLNKKEDLQFVLKAFSDKERKAIYDPFVKSINQEEYKVHITNSFFETNKSFSKIPSSTLKELFPIIEKKVSDSKLEMMEIIVPVDRSKAKITLRTKEIGNTLFAQPKKQFSKKVDMIQYGEEKVELKKQIEYTVKQTAETGAFTIIFTPLNIQLTTTDFTKIKEEFYKAFFMNLHYYQHLIENRGKVLSEKEKQVVKFFKSILKKKKIAVKV